MPTSWPNGKGVAGVWREGELLHGFETIAQGNEILQPKQPLPINGRAKIGFRHILRKIELHRHNLRTGVTMRSDLVTAEIFDQGWLWIRGNRIELIGRQAKTPPEIV